MSWLASLVIAGTLLFPAAPGRYHDWLSSSRMPTPRGVVTVKRHIPAECRRPGYVPNGCLVWRTHDQLDTTIYMRPGLPKKTERWTFLHELGHVADWRHLTPGERVELRVTLRMPDNRWWGAYDVPHGMTPAEIFADAYADCSVYGQAVAPTDREGRRACAAIKEAIQKEDP